MGFESLRSASGSSWVPLRGHRRSSGFRSHPSHDGPLGTTSTGESGTSLLKTTHGRSSPGRTPVAFVGVSGCGVDPLPVLDLSRSR